jgi:hypothetical protein
MAALSRNASSRAISTTWQSAKLFMVANEVVTRSEMRHQAGYVRHLITEPGIWINPKNLRPREEANHMNLVFLSNENQALLVPRKDRRFVVIRTPGPLPKERYEAVVKEVNNGGAAALYAFLLKRELGDFHTHTAPIWTQAKEDMIQLGLASPQLFWQDFYEGEFPLPYQPCLREDLYRAYLAWCARYGEKMPKRINQFIPEFKAMNGVSFDRVASSSTARSASAASRSCRTTRRSAPIISRRTTGSRPAARTSTSSCAISGRPTMSLAARFVPGFALWSGPVPGCG